MIRQNHVSRLGVGLGGKMFAIGVVLENAIFLPASVFFNPGRDCSTRQTML